MFLVEPPPTQGDVHFSLLGIPVRINPWFWLTAVLLCPSSLQQVGLGVLSMWVAAVLLCILLHELGHAVVMRYFGNEASIVLYSFGGMAIPRASRYGFRQPRPWGQILISFAGPASGFILAAGLALGLRYLGGYEVQFLEESWQDVVPIAFIPGHPQVMRFLYYIFQISVMWGLFNLLPVYPLDGGQIAQNVFALFDPQDSMRHALILSVIVGGLMCFAAFVQWNNWFLGVFFLWMTYTNFTALQSFRM